MLTSALLPVIAKYGLIFALRGSPARRVGFPGVAIFSYFEVGSRHLVDPSMTVTVPKATLEVDQIHLEILPHLPPRRSTKHLLVAQSSTS